VIRRILASSRFVIAFAVLGSFLAAVALIFYGFFTVAEMVWEIVEDHSVSPEGAKHYAVEFIELTDLFLLGTVLYIVALGLYELFVDQDLPLPAWLHITTLDDLKEKLIGVIIVLLGVTFLGDVVGETIHGVDVLYLGLAIAAVVVALTLQRWLDRTMKEKDEAGG
jgi:uncharacterized membrane protein YqhA